MQTCYKPPEVLQAQWFTFVSSVHHSVAQVSLEATPPFPIEPALTLPPAGIKEAYAVFLRSVGGSRDCRISRHAELLRAYPEFARYVSGGVFLVKGGESDLTSFERNGEQFVVRAPRENVARTLSAHVVASVLTDDKPGLEKIVAISYTEGVTVAKRMPGVKIFSTTLEDVKSITPDQITQFVDTIRTVHQRGLIIDFNIRGDNILYDKNAGFGIIDLSVRGTKTSELPRWPYFMTLAGNISGGMNALCAMGGLHQEFDHLPTEQNVQLVKELLVAILPACLQYREAAVEGLTEEERRFVQPLLDGKVNEIITKITNYSNPAK